MRDTIYVLVHAQILSSIRIMAQQKTLRNSTETTKISRKIVVLLFWKHTDPEMRSSLFAYNSHISDHMILKIENKQALLLLFILFEEMA